MGASASISRRRDRFHKKIKFTTHGKKPGRDVVRQADGYLNMNLGEQSGWWHKQRWVVSREMTPERVSVVENGGQGTKRTLLSRSQGHERNQQRGPG